MTPVQQSWLTGLAVSSYATLCVLMAFWISGLTLIPLLALPLASFMAWDFHFRDANKDFQFRELERLNLRNAELLVEIDRLKALMDDPRPISEDSSKR
jgi:hypothetical protein